MNALSSTRWQRKAGHSSAPAAIDIVFRPGESAIGEADPLYNRFVGRVCQMPPRGYNIKWWQFMELQTPRLILRSFGDEDVDAMAKLFANPDFMRFSLGVYTERKQTVAFIEKVMAWNRASMPSQFAVVPRGENRVIGYCGFHHHPEVPGEVEIGYRLHPDYWNRGLITEAARAVRDHAFADLKLPLVISLIHPENFPSRRVAEKNGMKVEKEITFRGFPTQVYAITREQWLASRDVS